MCNDHATETEITVPKDHEQRDGALEPEGIDYNLKLDLDFDLDNLSEYDLHDTLMCEEIDLEQMYQESWN